MAYNKVRIQLKRDTFENWNSCEQPLLSGEFSYDIDNNKIKIGDGITLWKDLPYVNADLSDIINVNDLSDNAVISAKNWTQSQNYTTYNYVKNELSNDGYSLHQDGEWAVRYNGEEFYTGITDPLIDKFIYSSDDKTIKFKVSAWNKVDKLIKMSDIKNTLSGLTIESPLSILLSAIIDMSNL